VAFQGIPLSHRALFMWPCFLQTHSVIAIHGVYHEFMETLFILVGVSGKRVTSPRYQTCICFLSGVGCDDLEKCHDAVNLGDRDTVLEVSESSVQLSLWGRYS